MRFKYLVNETVFLKSSQDDFDLQTYEDTKDHQSVIIPCRLSSPDETAFLLHPDFAENTYLPKRSQSELNVTMMWNISNYYYDFTRGIVIEKTKFKDYLHQLSTKNDSNYVRCVCFKHPKSIMRIKVNLHKTKILDKFNYSSEFLLDVSDQRAQCTSRSTNTNISVSNIHFIVPGEWIFLAQCISKNTTCYSDSYYSENKRVVLDRKQRNANKRFQECDEPVCTLYDIYLSGMIRCFTNDERVFIDELYFTGLDKQQHLLRNLKRLPNSSIISMYRTDVSGRTMGDLVKTHANESVSLTCKSIYFIVLPIFEWDVVFINGTESSLDYYSHYFHYSSYLSFVQSADGEMGVVQDTIVANIPPDVNEIKCKCYLRDTENDYILVSQRVYVKSAPVILNKENKYTFNREIVQNVLSCWVQAEPTPEVMWLHNGKELPLGIQYLQEKHGTYVNQLTFSNSTNVLQGGNYTCVANNSEGISSWVISVDVVDDIQNETPLLGFILSLTLGLIAVAAIFILIILIIFQQKSRVLLKADIDKFYNGISQKEVSGEFLDYACKPYKNDTEIDLENFTIETGFLLGSGSYGVVLKGQVKGQEVAVKTVEPNSEKSIVLALLDEIKIMSVLNDHPNIVSFIGAHTAKIAKGEVYLFMEFCELGSVEKFLRKKKSLMMDSDSPLSVCEKTELSKNMASWAVQTAYGMKYLAECKIIHGDLALRNLLLKDINTLKISDFGLARQLCNYAIYTKTQKQVLPWRHMSPESLSAMEFSVKSDVWAFGVTLWEMFSLGEIPYSGLQWAVDFTSSLEKGLRLSKPSFCSNEMFPIIEKCWNVSPNGRPDFEELFQLLQDEYLASYDNEYLKF